MIYILMIWTTVAMVGDRHGVHTRTNDWRSLGEFHNTAFTDGRQLCEDAARQLGLKTENYRCVRFK